VSRLSELCRELKIGDLEQLLSQVEYQNPEQYLTDLLERVLEQRRARRTERLIKQAGFPTIKTLEGYDFSPITFPQSMSRDELLTLEFIDRKENLCLLGNVGTGKTMLATALGVKACTKGKTVRFFRAVDLANELLSRYRSGEAGVLIKRITKADLLILDEMGYVPFEKKASEMLFSVISNSYEQQSIIITSNLEFGRWNEMFGDDRLTAALLDRIVHHAHILAFTGKSYRFRQAMAKKKPKVS